LESAPVVLPPRAPRAALVDCGMTQLRIEHRCEPVSSEPRHEPVSLASRHPGRGLASLDGVLTRPAGVDGPRPAVLLLGGSGPTDRDGTTSGGMVVRHAPFPLLARLADRLAERGLVVLRYDKRTCRRCYGTVPSGFRFHHLKDDAIDALAWLARQPGVDPARIVVMGHSQGGQLAPFVAAGQASVAALVLLGASVGPLEETLLEQLALVSHLHLEQWDPWSAAERSLERRALARCFSRLSDDFEAEEVCVGGGVTQAALREGEALFRETLPALEAFDGPRLVVAGRLDGNVPAAVAQQIATALPQAEVHIVDQVGHTFVPIDTVDTPILSPEMLAVVVDFLGSIPRTAPTSIP
jgi:dienelactone hydrolase